MTTSGVPTAAYDIAVDLLACAAAGVANAPDGAGAIGRSCVVWGAIARDCGQLVVSISRQAPSNSFPIEGVGAVDTRCGPKKWLLYYTVEVTRCIDLTRDPPLCDTLAAEARVATIDAWAVRNAVSCCLHTMRTELQPGGGTAISDYWIREQNPIGPEGGIAGSSLVVIVGLLNCLCVETGS